MAKYGLGRGAVIEPFPYSDVGCANDDTNMPMSEASHPLQSPSEVPYVRVPVYDSETPRIQRSYEKPFRPNQLIIPKQQALASLVKKLST